MIRIRDFVAGFLIVMGSAYGIISEHYITTGMFIGAFVLYASGDYKDIRNSKQRSKK